MMSAHTAVRLLRILPGLRVVFTAFLCVFGLASAATAGIVDVASTANDVREAAKAVGGMTSLEIMALVTIASIGGLVWTQWARDQAIVAMSKDIAVIRSEVTAVNTKLDNRPCSLPVLVAEHTAGMAKVAEHARDEISAAGRRAKG